MDTSAFDSRIQAVDNELAQIRERGELIIKAFAEEAARFAVTWTQEEVQTTVKSQPEKTKEMGLEKLKELKADLNQLSTDYLEHSRVMFNQDSLWAHRGTFKPDPDYSHTGGYHPFNERSGPKKLMEPLQELLGYGGALIKKYGLMRPTTYPTGSDYMGWNRGGKAGFKQTTYFDWSSELMAVASQYADLYKELVSSENNRKKIEREKAEAEAQDLWNQA